MSTSKIKLSKQAFADADLDFNAKKITNLAEPVSSGDVATKNYVDSMLGANDAMQFKGTIGTGGTHTIAAFNALTTYGAGWTYRVVEAGTIRGKVCEIGDLVIVITDRSGSGNLDADFTVAQTNIDGGVVGPANATDNAIARFDSTTGKVIQNSLASVDDNGSMNIPTGQSYKINGAALSEDDIADGTTNKKYTATEKTKLSGIAANADVTSATNVGSSINGASAKATLVDGDKFAIIDSEAANALKTSLWSVIKSTLKTYFDTLYPSMSNYIVRETPTGTKNGSNTDFTLANTPVSGKEMVFVNGLLMNAGAGNDYTISGAVITFLTGAIPISTDTILVTYWK